MRTTTSSSSRSSRESRRGGDSGRDLLASEGRPDEAEEQRMRRLRTGEELGVVLDPDEERMVRDLEHLDPAVDAHARDREPVLAEALEIIGVDLVPVSVALPDLGAPVDLGNPRAGRQQHALGTQAHRSAEVVEVLLLLEKADDRIRRGLLDLGSIRMR